MRTRKELEAREKIYAELIAIYNANASKTLAELARQSNVSYASLRKYAIQQGCQIRRNFCIPRTTDETISSIVEEYISNPSASIQETAAKYCISKPTLVRWIKNKGYKTHKYPKEEPIEKDKLDKALNFYNNVKSDTIAAAKYAGIGKNKFRKYLKEHNLLLKKFTIQKNIEYDNSFFETLDTEEKAYWFGFIYGDGSVRDSGWSHQLTIELQESDVDHLEKFKRSIQSNKNLVFRTKKNNSGGVSNMYSITISSKKIVKDLIDKGCIPNKTYDGKLSYKFKTDSLRAAFLRGYIDADGWISKTIGTYSMSIVVKSYRIMNYLNRMIIELSGVIPYIRYESEERGGAYRIRITNKKDFFQFLDIIYKNATIYMNRKYENYKLHCRPEPTTAEGSESINGVLSGKAVTP